MLSELTDTFIDTLEEGRSLDYLIAEHVMGWQRDGAKLTPPKGMGTVADNYSTNIAAAFRVVDALTTGDRQPNPLYFKLVYRWGDSPKFGPPTWAVFDWKCTGDSHPLYSARADAVSLAICRAALKVVANEWKTDDEA